jgi:CNT family concentrative nucleoside transporter
MQALLGVAFFPLLAWSLSEDHRRFPWKLALTTLSLQLAFAILFRGVPALQELFLGLSRGVELLNEATQAGATYMFGYLAGGKLPFEETREDGASFIIAFRVLPIVLVTSALASILYHFRIIPWMVQALSWLLRRTVGGDSLSLFTVATSVFFGVIETPVLFKEHIAQMNRSQLFVMLTAIMSTIAGTVLALYASVLNPVVPNAIGEIIIASLMSAPAAILMARIMVPSCSSSQEQKSYSLPRLHENTFSALVSGVQDGIQMVLGIAGFIIVLFSLVHLANGLLGLLPTAQPLTLQSLLAVPYRPLIWLTGLSWSESAVGSQLMSTKTILNEFVSYLDLAKLPEETLSQKSRVIMTYSLCGFANLGSLGIVISGLGVIAPERRKEISSLALRSVFAGNLATLLTGAVIGLVLTLVSE